ncbi:MAG: helix-turn-helix transcriptional regulator, partial [Clostridia bacterium]
MNNIKEIVSTNLIKLRKNANLTQAELAEKLNYSDKAVSKWE